MARQQILGLDIGSHTIKAIVVEPIGDGKLSIVKSFCKPSKGLRRGAVVDMDGLVNTISALFDDVADYSKSALKNVYLNLSSLDATVRISTGSAAVSRANSEIHKDDIDRAVENSVPNKARSNRMNLHILNREFIVDGVGDIHDPLGMVGAKVEVVNLIVEVFEPSVRNLEKCIKLAGGIVAGEIFTPLASAKSVLTDTQKELGVVLIDVGASTTSMAVYEENKLLHTKVLKFGSQHVTNDLGLALEITPEFAERVKIAHGYAMAKEITSREHVDLKTIDSDLKGAPSKRFVAEVIEARLSEICELVNDELKSIGKEKNLPGGAVIVGGGAKMPGMADLVQRELRLPTQIGIANSTLYAAKDVNAKELLASPEYTCALGLPLFSEEVGAAKVRSSKSPGGMFKKMLDSVLP